MTSELVFLTRPTVALKKLLEGVITVPDIDGDASVEVSVGTVVDDRSWNVSRHVKSSGHYGRIGDENLRQFA